MSACMTGLRPEPQDVAGDRKTYTSTFSCTGAAPRACFTRS
jgi:hypothetical protein